MRFIASVVLVAASVIAADAADLKVPVSEIHTRFNKFALDNRVEVRASRGECDTTGIRTVCRYQISSAVNSSIGRVNAASDTASGLANEVEVIVGFTGKNHSDAEYGLATYEIVIGILSPDAPEAELRDIFGSLFGRFVNSGRNESAEIGSVKYLLTGTDENLRLVVTPVGN